MSSLFYFGVKELSIDPQYIVWEMPIIQILLILRQHMVVTDKKKSGIDLFTQEAIDNGEIDRKLREKALQTH